MMQITKTVHDAKTFNK